MNEQEVSSQSPTPDDLEACYRLINDETIQEEVSDIDIDYSEPYNTVQKKLRKKLLYLRKVMIDEWLPLLELSMEDFFDDKEINLPKQGDVQSDLKKFKLDGMLVKDFVKEYSYLPLIFFNDKHMERKLYYRPFFKMGLREGGKHLDSRFIVERTENRDEYYPELENMLHFDSFPHGILHHGNISETLFIYVFFKVQYYKDAVSNLEVQNIDPSAKYRNTRLIKELLNPTLNIQYYEEDSQYNPDTEENERFGENVVNNKEYPLPNIYNIEGHKKGMYPFDYICPYYIKAIIYRIACYESDVLSDKTYGELDGSYWNDQMPNDDIMDEVNKEIIQFFQSKNGYVHPEFDQVIPYDISQSQLKFYIHKQKKEVVKIDFKQRFPFIRTITVFEDNDGRSHQAKSEIDYPKLGGRDRKVLADVVKQHNDGMPIKLAVLKAQKNSAFSNINRFIQKIISTDESILLKQGDTIVWNRDIFTSIDIIYV